MKAVSDQHDGRLVVAKGMDEYHFERMTREEVIEVRWRLAVNRCTSLMACFKAIRGSVGPLGTVVFTGCGMTMEVLSCTLSSAFPWSGGSEVFIKEAPRP